MDQNAEKNEKLESSYDENPIVMMRHLISQKLFIILSQVDNKWF